MARPAARLITGGYGNWDMRGEAIDEGLWRRHAWLNRIQSLALLLFMGGFPALLGGAGAGSASGAYGRRRRCDV